MFERFTSQARSVVVTAQEEARQLGHNYIGTEHLLLGLLPGDGVAARALATSGVTADATRTAIATKIGTQPPLSVSHIPFTPRAKRVLELSLRQALSLGHNYIGTEHVLLGLLQDGEGVGPEILTERGLDFGALRSLVLMELGVESPAGPVGTAGRFRGLRRRWTGGPSTIWATGRTPGQVEVAKRALTLAAGRPVGTQHMLRALAVTDDTAARRVLESLGIDAHAVAAAAESVDVSGTSDSAAGVQIEKESGAITLRFDDPAVNARLQGLEGDALTTALAEVLGGHPPTAPSPADEAEPNDNPR